MEARLQEAVGGSVGHWLSPWTLQPDPGFEPRLCCLPTVSSWASHLTSLWFSFLNCEMETIVVSPSRHSL